MSMNFLPEIDKDNTMLLNTIYHRGRKETDYNDHLDIIYKDLDTGEKKLKTITNPPMMIYFADEDSQNNEYNRAYIEIENAVPQSCKYKDLPFFIAKQAGPEYMSYVKNAIQSKNRRSISNIHKYKNVFGSDYDIENWYKIQWYLNKDNSRQKPITKQYLDIEVDSIDVPGFPKDGECPINAVSVVDETDMTCFVFLLRNEKNPLIKEFEDTIDSFIGELHEAFDDTYGKLEYKFYMYDDEIDLIVDLFKLINTLKRDFLLIWNLSFDINFIIARIKNLGLDPHNVMCHSDFAIKELYYKKDKRNFNIENKSDYFKISSYTVFLDQMLVYAGLRKGQGAVRSYQLNAVAQGELGDEKLDYSAEANIKTLPYVDFKKFVMYNIKDTLLQMGIENKTDDVDNIYQRAYSNATTYEKIFKQTIFLKNRAYIEYYRQGLIIANNINIDYSLPFTDNKSKKSEDEDEKFDGALVADPTLNEQNGIEIMGAISKYIFDNVVDMDFSAMYPKMIYALNIAPSTMIGKLIIDESIQKVYQNASDKDKLEDQGKDFMENILVGNPGNLGKKWFNLPGIEKLVEEVEKQFGRKTRRITLDKSHIDKYHVLPLVIEFEKDGNK